jgi:hypothetical protein
VARLIRAPAGGDFKPLLAALLNGRNDFDHVARAIRWLLSYTSKRV